MCVYVYTLCVYVYTLSVCIYIYSPCKCILSVYVYVYVCVLRVSRSVVLTGRFKDSAASIEKRQRIDSSINRHLTYYEVETLTCT